MKGIEFFIEKTTSEVSTVLIKPQVQSTLEVFELSFARFSLEALQIAEILVANSNLQKHIPVLFQRLVSKLKDSRSCKPEKPESEEEIHLQDDQVTRFLNTRKNARNSQNISELQWFLGEAEKKKKDTENFLEHVSKLGKKMEVSMQAVVKQNHEVQTELIWISDLTVTQGSTLDLNRMVFGVEKSCGCSQKNKGLEKDKQKSLENGEQLNQKEQKTGLVQQTEEKNEEVNFQILQASKKLQNVKNKKTRDSKRTSTFTPKKNRQPRSSRSPQNLFAETETNIPSNLKEVKQRQKIINSVSSSPSKPTPKIAVFKAKIERMVSLSESREQIERNSFLKSSMSQKSESNKQIEKEVLGHDNERGEGEEKEFDKMTAKTSAELEQKKWQKNLILGQQKNSQEEMPKQIQKYENSKLELILQSEEVVEVENIKSSLFQNLTPKLTSNFAKAVTLNLSQNLPQKLAQNKSAQKIGFVSEGSKSIEKKEESFKQKKERRANYLKQLLSIKKQKKEPLKQISLSEKQNANCYSSKASDDKRERSQKKMSKIYTVHRQSQIEESQARRQSDDKQIQKSEYKLSFEGFEEKFKTQTVQRFENKMKTTGNKDEFKTLPSIHRNKLELNKLLPKEDDKIQQNLMAKMKNEKGETFHGNFKQNNGNSEQIQQIDYESSSVAEMMKKDKVIIDKINQLQKNGKQNESQIRFYVDVLERTHLRFCGKNCKHLQRFYKHLKLSNSWANRVPIALATRKIGFFS